MRAIYKREMRSYSSESAKADGGSVGGTIRSAKALAEMTQNKSSEANCFMTFIVAQSLSGASTSRLCGGCSRGKAFGSSPRRFARRRATA